MIVKIMSEEDLADNNVYKLFALHEAEDVKFERDEYGIHVILTRTLPGENNYSQVTFLARGNIYVLNESGKTVESIGIGKVKPYPDNYDLSFNYSVMKDKSGVISPIPVKYGKSK